MSSAAATKLVARAISSTEKIDSSTPSPSASSGATRPAGSGRLAVRFIKASRSRSYHMLMAPAAPEPSAIASTARKASNGWMCAGAISRPTRPVNTTSDMTRGFSRST